MRKRILDAARELFVKDGFSHVTMRQLARRIEYSPGTIYRYFKDKAEIFQELREDAIAEFVSGQMRCAGEPDPRKRLRALGRGYLLFAIQQPEKFELLFNPRATDPLDPRDHDADDPSFQLFVHTVEQCLDTGELGEADLETTLVSLWSLVHGMACLANSGQLVDHVAEQDILRVYDRATRFVLRPVNT